jgi:SAM-dependent methyltransferase
VATEPSQTWASREAVEVWRRGLERRRQALAAATERLLDRANLRAGSRVLDLAAGTGEQSLLAIQRVGPSGSVLATDISASMLEVAEQSAREAGADNLQTRIMDLTSLERRLGRFDAVICRLGLMFASDLGATLRGVLEVLEPDARFAAVVWASRERNPFMGLPDGIADRLGWPLGPRQTLHRALSLGDPARLEAAFRAAGFEDVLVEPVAAPRAFGSAAEAAHYARTDSPVWRDLVAEVPPTEAERFWQEVERAFKPFERPSGCVIPAEVLVASGARQTRV